MGACKSCSQVILVLINILFSLIGITLLVVGSIVRWGTKIMDQYLADIYSEFTKSLAHVSDADLHNFDIADLIGDVTLSFIVIGAFFFVIGILGCIGACCTVRPMLIMYVVILTILVLAEIAFVIVLFAARSKVDEGLKKPFKKTLEEYKGIHGDDAISLGLNFIMSEYKCCGVDGYRDFNSSSLWNKTFYEKGVIGHKEIPVVCCKMVNDTNCWENPNTNNSYKDQGCYDAIENWLNDNLAPLIGTSAGILVVEILLVIFACVACSKERKDTEGFDDDDSYNKPITDDRSYDAIRAYENQGYRGPHHNRQPYNGYDDRGQQDYKGYRGGPNDNRGYQGRSEYDVPKSRSRDRHY